MKENQGSGISQNRLQMPLSFSHNSPVICHVPLSVLLSHHIPPPQNLHVCLFSRPFFPPPHLSISLPPSFILLFLLFFFFLCSLSTEDESGASAVYSVGAHTLVHTNGKQIAGPVKWKKIDYLYLVTEHTHACACSKGGGGRTLGRCIEPSQGERK